MNKPEFLYHGSQYYFDILRPQKACGETQLESQFAIGNGYQKKKLYQ